MHEQEIIKTIIQMAGDIADTASTVRSIKETQDKGFEQQKKDNDRISKLESFQRRVVYTAGGLSAGISLTLPKISNLIAHLFSP